MRAAFIEEAILAWSNPEGLVRLLREEARGRANSLNPLDHPWWFDSAMVAKHRLRAITRADRKACGDGKWVKTENSLFWAAVVAYAFGHRQFVKPMSLSEVYHNLKPRYRWEWRR